METKDKIRKHIAEVGISQSKLAELSGLAFGTINRILNGKQELLPNTLAKIAEALNLSVSQLMQDEAVEVMDAEVQGYIEYDGEIRKIKSFTALQKLVAQIEYETKVLPKEAKAIIATNKENKASIKKQSLNKQYHFNTDWSSIYDYDTTNVIVGVSKQQTMRKMAFRWIWATNVAVIHSHSMGIHSKQAKVPIYVGNFQRIQKNVDAYKISCCMSTMGTRQRRK